MENTLIAVVGPTAIGKTAWAIRIAKHYNAEIISADSRQFYREMTIGTAVPGPEELAQVPHHFVQHLSIQDPWTVGDFERNALELLDKLYSENKVALVVGGSGLYIKALTEGLDEFPEVNEEARQTINQRYKEFGLGNLQKELKKIDPDYFELVDIQNPHRLIRALEVYQSSGKPFSSFLNKAKPHRPFQIIFLGIHAKREIIYQRIEERVDKMMADGLLEEARNLWEYKNLKALQTVGYQELFRYLEGEWELEKAVSEIKKNTRRFAKRQLTWFRKIKDITWIDYEEELSTVIESLEARINP